MSTHKNFDKICCVVLAFVLLITVLFVNGERLGIKPVAKTLGYEDKLFDTSIVHTLDIVIDDWDSFLKTCTDEEYTVCSVVIDNEAFHNVALRAKGNTSLTNVKSCGNNRYSLKIEFDKYDSTKTYHGLDKLCLNNIIQDNTYMKDYLCYTMMGDFGVASPLCSYVYITVNGEDWGLFLAVEGIEDSFLQRNYGGEDGNLYKPDSMQMGGGRGNGKGFDMNELRNESETTEREQAAQNGNNTAESTAAGVKGMAFAPPENGNPQGGGMQPPDGLLGGGNGAPPAMPGGEMPGGQPPEMPNGETPEQPNTGEAPAAPEAQTESAGEAGEKAAASAENREDEETRDNGSRRLQKDFGGYGGMGGSGGRGSSDVKLIYSDDDFSSYSNIFDNAKTKVSDSDKKRLIASLKKINENTDIENAVNAESVIRYFAVHNFVLNFDSYTGSMIHNYYLYEQGGRLSMIPWDYNLAFGGFMSMGGAESLVNYPIDSPVSGGDTESRPMLAWIFNSEEYTRQYHALLRALIAAFFDSGKTEREIDRVKAMITPYVEKDPTKFCTYEEFEKGIDTLKSFCLLRAESIGKQLDGTIGSTSEAQTDKSNFVKADGITVSDMGSMGNMGGEKGERPDIAETQGDSQAAGSEGITTETPDAEQGFAPPQMPNGEMPESFTPPDSSNSERSESFTPPDNSNSERSEGFTPPDNSNSERSEGFTPPDSSNSERPGDNGGTETDGFEKPAGGNSQGRKTDRMQTVIVFAASFAVLIIGILFALFYRRRRG